MRVTISCQYCIAFEVMLLFLVAFTIYYCFWFCLTCLFSTYYFRLSWASNRSDKEQPLGTARVRYSYRPQ